MNFFSIYASFDNFYNSFFRGNEVEFIYENDSYYLLPIFNNSKKVIGVCFGKAYANIDIECRSKDELYHVQINGSFLGDILDKIVITWHNF